MNQNFNLIATIYFKHNYFKDGVFKTIVFAVAEDSTKLLKDLGIVFKYFSGGFHLLSANTGLLDSEREENSLNIYIYCNDPYYINYTNLTNAYSPTKDILYFNNLKPRFSRTDDNGNDISYLHNEEYAGESEILRLTNGQFIIPSFDSTKTYAFNTLPDNRLDDENIKESRLVEGEFSVSNVSEGIIKIVTIDKNDTQEELIEEQVNELYHYPNVIWKKPMAIIELFTKTLSDDFVKDGEKIIYCINFNNIKTKWKYFLTSPIYKKFSDLKIIQKDNGTTFRKAIKTQIQDNNDIMIIESENEIPLLEYSENTYQLKGYDTKLRSNKLIIENLVHASPEQLYFKSQKNNVDNQNIEEGTSKKIIYSHIYI